MARWINLRRVFLFVWACGLGVILRGLPWDGSDHQLAQAVVRGDPDTKHARNAFVPDGIRAAKQETEEASFLHMYANVVQRSQGRSLVDDSVFDRQPYHSQPISEQRVAALADWSSMARAAKYGEPAWDVEMPAAAPPLTAAIGDTSAYARMRPYVQLGTSMKSDVPSRFFSETPDDLRSGPSFVATGALAPSAPTLMRSKSSWLGLQHRSRMVSRPTSHLSPAFLTLCVTAMLVAFIAFAAFWLTTTWNTDYNLDEEDEQIATEERLDGSPKPSVLSHLAAPLFSRAGTGSTLSARDLPGSEQVLVPRGAKFRLLFPSLVDIVTSARSSASLAIRSERGEPLLSLRLWSNQSASAEILEYMNVCLSEAVDTDLYICIFTYQPDCGYRCEIATGGPPADFMGYLTEEVNRAGTDQVYTLIAASGAPKLRVYISGGTDAKSNARTLKVVDAIDTSKTLASRVFVQPDILVAKNNVVDCWEDADITLVGTVLPAVDRLIALKIANERHKTEDAAGGSSGGASSALAQGTAAGGHRKAAGSAPGS